MICAAWGPPGRSIVGKRLLIEAAFSRFLRSCLSLAISTWAANTPPTAARRARTNPSGGAASGHRAAAAQATYVPPLPHSPQMHRNAEHEEKINDKEASQRLANVHIGRGGAGNVRSPSRDRAVREQYDEDRLREMEQQKRLQSEALEASVRASGRGGRGNIPVPPSHEVERGRSRTSSPRGAVAGVLRSISRSRSQDARSSPGARARSTSRARSSGLGRVQEDS